MPVAKAYRSVLPYRKAARYSGADLSEVIQGWGHSAIFAAPTETPAPDARSLGVPWARSSVFGAVLSLPVDGLAVAALSVAAANDALQPHAADTALPTDAIAPHERTVRAPEHDLPAHGRQLSAPTDGLATHQRGLRAPIRQAGPHQVVAQVPWDALLAHARSASGFWRALVARNAFIALPWSPLGHHSFTGTTLFPVEHYDDDPLVFPVRRVYVMIPTLAMVRLPERTPIPILSADIAGDAGGWAWTFTAAIPRTALPLVSPAEAEDPVEVEIAVNGWIWTFLVEGFDDQKRFNVQSASIRGRSRSAVLAPPYAPVRSYTESEERNASQLADQELTDTGFTLDWTAVDWLVPPDTFSYADLAPIEAIARVAAAIGASVQTDPEDKVVHVAPGYATSPWEWSGATPWAIVPAEVLTAGDGSWRGGPNANGVYVYSERAGYGALVKLTGTDGAELLPQVVDALTVAADPARERGRVELARAGRILECTRTIPLFPAPAEPGLVPIGALLQVEDSEDDVWRGQVTGVRINATRSGGAASVRQTLSLERQIR